jgi:RecA/RadA recombinase
MYRNWLLKKLEFPLKYSINTIFGPSGVGKTTLAYLIAKEELENGKEVYFIDTEKGFSLKRFKQIFENFDSFADKFFKIEIRNFDELNEFLRRMDLNNKVLIVDSISMPYRLRLKDDFEEINKEIVKTLDILLNKLNESNKVILISHSYFKDNEHRIVGGDIMKYYSKVLVEMNFEGELRTLRLVKHKYKKELKVKVEVFEKGFKEKKFLF